MAGMRAELAAWVRPPPGAAAALVIPYAALCIAPCSYRRPRWRACYWTAAGLNLHLTLHLNPNMNLNLNACTGAQAAGDEGGCTAWGRYMAMLDAAHTDSPWLAPLAELLGAVLHADPAQRPSMAQVHARLTVCQAALHL